MTMFKPCDRVHLKGHAHTPHTTGTVTGTTPEGRVLVRWDDNQAVTPHNPQHLEPAGEPMTEHFKLSEHLIEKRARFAPSSSVITESGDVTMNIGGGLSISRLAEVFLEWQAEQYADKEAFQAEGVALYRAYYAATYDESTDLDWDDLDADQKNLARELATTARELHPESNR